MAHSPGVRDRPQPYSVYADASREPNRNDEVSALEEELLREINYEDREKELKRSLDGVMTAKLGLAVNKAINAWVATRPVIKNKSEEETFELFEQSNEATIFQDVEDEIREMIEARLGPIEENLRTRAARSGGSRPRSDSGHLSARANVSTSLGTRLSQDLSRSSRSLTGPSVGISRERTSSIRSEHSVSSAIPKNRLTGQASEPVGKVADSETPLPPHVTDEGALNGLLADTASEVSGPLSRPKPFTDRHDRAINQPSEPSPRRERPKSQSYEPRGSEMTNPVAGPADKSGRSSHRSEMPYEQQHGRLPSREGFKMPNNNRDYRNRGVQRPPDRRRSRSPPDRGDHRQTDSHKDHHLRHSHEGSGPQWRDREDFRQDEGPRRSHGVHAGPRHDLRKPYIPRNPNGPEIDRYTPHRR